MKPTTLQRLALLLSIVGLLGSALGITLAVSSSSQPSDDARGFVTAGGGFVPSTAMPLFSASQKGAVPASGGGTTKFLRADRTWVETSAAGLDVFGTGADGDLVWDGTSVVLGITPAGNAYDLNRDIWPNDMTVNAGITIRTRNFAIFGDGTLTVTPTSVIRNTGNGGGAGASGCLGGGGARGSAIAVGRFAAVPIGGLGGGNTGGCESGGGSNTAYSSAVAGALAAGTQGAGGASCTAGGDAPDGTVATRFQGGGGGGGGGRAFGMGGAACAGGTVTAPAATATAYPWDHSCARTGMGVKDISAHTTGSSGGGGGVGANGGSSTNGCAGGSGTTAGQLYVAFRTIVCPSCNNTLVFNCGGGVGGAGAAASANNDGGGGGGGGGSGGLCTIVTAATCVNNSDKTEATITLPGGGSIITRAFGGSGGVGGAGHGTGCAGGAGGNGSPGVAQCFQP